MDAGFERMSGARCAVKTSYKPPMPQIGKLKKLLRIC